MSCDPGSETKPAKGHKKNLSIDCDFDTYDLHQKLLDDEASDELLEINSLIFRFKMKDPALQDDSDEDLDEDSKALFVNAQNGTKIHRKDLLQYIVKKVNGMGGIRTLHKIFIIERRSLLNFHNPNAVISEEYFKVCAQFTPMLELKRKQNLNKLYERAQRSVNQFKMYELEDIQKKIDYEKICNLGLYRKQQDYSEQLLEMTLEELTNIQEHCNDQVMKQYKINKGRSWAQKVSENQLYQVFQCFSEDQVFFYQGFEYALLERLIAELQDGQQS